MKFDTINVRIKGQLIRFKWMFLKTLNYLCCSTHNLNDLLPKNVRCLISNKHQGTNLLSPFKIGFNNWRNIKSFFHVLEFHAETRTSWRVLLNQGSRKLQNKSWLTHQTTIFCHGWAYCFPQSHRFMTTTIVLQSKSR